MSTSAANSNAPATTANTAANTQGLFQCGFCKKHYKRVDHLARHVRSHTKSKPYQCQSCPKAFGRADLLKRHAAGHEARPQQQQQRSPNSEQNVGRVTTACQTCASCHLRCSEEKPCRRCSSKGIECIWSDGAVVVQQPLSPPTSQQLPISPATASLLSETLTSEGLGADDMVMPMTHETIVVNETPGVGHHAGLNNDGTIDVAATIVHDGFQDLSFPEFNLPTGEWTPMGGFNFDLGTELDDLDLGFLESYNTSSIIPLHLDDSTNRDDPNHDVTMEDVTQPTCTAWVDHGNNNSTHHEPREEPVVIRTDAFQNSHWRFQPSSSDHRGAEEHNLSLAGASGPGVESRIRILRGGRRQPPPRATTAPLSSSSRDRILSLVIANCSPENLDRAVSAFPSVEVLDALLQFYLSSSSSSSSAFIRASSFLHLPTFDPNRKRAELIAALVAAGAVLTSDPALARMGYAIQECVRTAVPRQWERQNPTTRDLELLQAFAINLETAIWSGHSRKVEIAESFLQPTVTILRRSKKLGPGGGGSGRGRSSSSSSLTPTTTTTTTTTSPYPDPDITAGDDGDVLTEKWTAWARNESFKRLVFRLITHDADSSLALLVNPLISYAEVLLPLPCSPELWATKTPEEWKHVLLAAAAAQGGGNSTFSSTTSSSSSSCLSSSSSSSTSRIPRDIPSCIANPETLILPPLTDMATTTTTDMTTTLQTCISVIWGMAWEYIQQSSFLQRTSSSSSYSSSLSQPPLCTTTTTTTSKEEPSQSQLLLLHSRRTHLLTLLSRFRHVLFSYSSFSSPFSSRPDNNPSASSSSSSSSSSRAMAIIPPTALAILQMRLETVALHLHVPFSELQMLAGMEGAERAEVALGSVRGWVGRGRKRRGRGRRGGGGGNGGEVDGKEEENNDNDDDDDDARKAVWYAGQVLRFAYRVRDGGGGNGHGEEGGGGESSGEGGGEAGEDQGMVMQGVVAIMVYHAGLTLWVYGLMMFGSSGGGGNRGGGQSSIPKGRGRGGGRGMEKGGIWLDDGESEGAVMQKFLELSDEDVGYARLRLGHHHHHHGDREEEGVPLSDPGKILDGIVGLLRGSRKTQAPRPRLVDQLILLLGELRKSQG